MRLAVIHTLSNSIVGQKVLVMRLWVKRNRSMYLRLSCLTFCKGISFENFNVRRRGRFLFRAGSGWTRR